jgi:hypothetical protein
MDADRFARLGRRGDDGFRGEVERDAENVGVLDIEETFFIQVV